MTSPYLVEIQDKWAVLHNGNFRIFLILFLTVHLIGNLQLLAGDGGEKFNYKTLGTRHSSMIDAVGHYDNCIGYVLSQDGPIRACIKKDNKTLLCWPDCSATFYNYY